MEFDWTTEQFLEEVDSVCGSKPVNKADLSADTLRSCLLLLWNTEEIFLFGVLYRQEAIRSLLLSKLTPDCLSIALTFFRRCPAFKTVHQLAELVFGSLVLGDIVWELMLEHDFSPEGAAP